MRLCVAISFFATIDAITPPILLAVIDDFVLSSKRNAIPHVNHVNRKFMQDGILDKFQLRHFLLQTVTSWWKEMMAFCTKDWLSLSIYNSRDVDYLCACYDSYVRHKGLLADRLFPSPFPHP